MSQYFRYELQPAVSWEDIESSYLLARWGIEGIYGETRSRLEACHWLDADERRLAIDASHEPGRNLGRLFAAYLTRTCGPGSFTVSQVASHPRRRTTCAGGW